MSVQLVDSSGKDDLKTQFITREGEYRLMTLSEYSRPNRVGYQNNQSNPQVRVSLVTLPSSQVTQQQAATVAGSSGSAAAASNGMERQENATSGSGGGSPGCSPPVGGDRICFNYGKELYVYAYRGVKKVYLLVRHVYLIYVGTFCSKWEERCKSNIDNIYPFIRFCLFRSLLFSHVCVLPRSVCVCAHALFPAVFKICFMSYGLIWISFNQRLFNRSMSNKLVESRFIPQIIAV